MSAIPLQAMRSAFRRKDKVMVQFANEVSARVAK